MLDFGLLVVWVMIRVNIDGSCTRFHNYLMIMGSFRGKIHWVAKDFLKRSASLISGGVSVFASGGS